MTQQQALTPFEGLESFKGYTEEQKLDYARDLFQIEQDILTGEEFISHENMESALENLAHLRWCKDFFDWLYRLGSQFVIEHIEKENGVTVSDGKFSVATKKGYDYSVLETWLSFKEEEKAVSEGRKEFEKVCREGGFFGGQKIEKLDFVTEKELRFKIEK